MKKFLGFDVKINEDVFFSRYVEKVAPKEVNQRFSCETEFRLGTFGYHAIDEWLSEEECQRIRTQYLPTDKHE
ncbi:MAG: hypothetical protein SFW35_04630 [Chitinophagales bacterium]|nr:hypothetical protein [Chitinophagales bacterium]